MLNGPLYQDSDLRIKEHYADTSGFTDQVFAQMHLLGCRFALRIRDLKNTRLYMPVGGTTTRGYEQRLVARVTSSIS